MPTYAGDLLNDALAQNAVGLHRSMTGIHDVSDGHRAGAYAAINFEIGGYPGL